MSLYQFIWVVHPWTVQLTVWPLTYHTKFWEIKYNIINNQIYWEFNESLRSNFDEFTVKNSLNTFLQWEISIIGYANWYWLDVEIVRIICKEKDVDFVNSNGYLWIIERNNKPNHLNEMVEKIRKVIGKSWDSEKFLRTCFRELNKAIRYSLDTPFHCLRALESLRHYCWSKYKINSENYPKNKWDWPNYLEKHQWKKFEELTGYNESDIDWKHTFAFDARHGNLKDITSEERKKIILKTWDIVDAFLDTQI